VIWPKAEAFAASVSLKVHLNEPIIALQDDALRAPEAEIGRGHDDRE